jgi:hypothetical protein
MPFSSVEKSAKMKLYLSLFSDAFFAIYGMPPFGRNAGDEARKRSAQSMPIEAARSLHLYQRANVSAREIAWLAK